MGDEVKINPELLELESRKRKLEADIKAFEEAKAKWESESKKAPAPVNKVEFDIDEALSNPFEYFTANGLTEDDAFELAQSIFFTKFPGKAPAEFSTKRNERMLSRNKKLLEKKQAEFEERVKREAEEKQVEQTRQAIFNAFKSVAGKFSKDNHPFIHAWFAQDGEEGKEVFDEDGYFKALIDIASGKKEGDTYDIEKLPDELNDWLGKRISRYKPKQEVKSEVVPETKVEDKGPDTVSVKDTSVVSRSPALSREERAQRAVEAMKRLDS